MVTPTVTVYGWELHNSSGGSDKFYRILQIEQVVLFNWGARDGRGQFQAHNVASTAHAERLAAEQTDAKVAKHYVVTRDMTAFQVPGDVAEVLTTLPAGKLNNPAPQTCDQIVKAFKRAADQTGTASPEASR